MNIKFIFAGALLATTVFAHADSVLWYGGDYNDTGEYGLSSEENGIIPDAQTYDNFTLTSTATITQFSGTSSTRLTGPTRPHFMTSDRVFQPATVAPKLLPARLLRQAPT